MKPIIGIVMARAEDGRLAIFGSYVESIERAGGVPVLLAATPEVDADTIQQWVKLCDGFLLTGGDDVAPVHYGESPLPQLGATDRVRDRVEIELCHAAAAAQKPMLGICRGSQIMNVAFGGSLWQDVATQCQGTLGHAQKTRAWEELHHSITLVRDSRLAAIMGGGAQQECNSFHHQAMHAVAPGFCAVAHAPDGVVEAIERQDGCMIGVEWHPERLPSYEAHCALFTWLVEQSKAKA